MWTRATTSWGGRPLGPQMRSGRRGRAALGREAFRGRAAFSDPSPGIDEPASGDYRYSTLSDPQLVPRVGVVTPLTRYQSPAALTTYRALLQEATSAA